MLAIKQTVIQNLRSNPTLLIMTFGEATKVGNPMTMGANLPYLHY